MKRSTLLIISLLLSVIGIFIIYLVKPEVSPQSLELTGTVKHVYQHENVAFIAFVPDNLTVVYFGKSDLEP